MGFDGLRVNHAGLETAADQMGATVKRMTDALDRLATDVEKWIAEGGWEGDQKEAYWDAKRQWEWAMTQMTALLDDTSKTVYQSNADYARADLKGAHRFSGM